MQHVDNPFSSRKRTKNKINKSIKTRHKRLSSILCVRRREAQKHFPSPFYQLRALGSRQQSFCLEMRKIERPEMSFSRRRRSLFFIAVQRKKGGVKRLNDEEDATRNTATSLTSAQSPITEIKAPQITPGKRDFIEADFLVCGVLRIFTKLLNVAAPPSPAVCSDPRR